MSVKHVKTAYHLLEPRVLVLEAGDDGLCMDWTAENREGLRGSNSYLTKSLFDLGESFAESCWRLTNVDDFRYGGIDVKTNLSEFRNDILQVANNNVRWATNRSIIQIPDIDRGRDTSGNVVNT